MQSLKIFDIKKNKPWAEDLTVVMQLGLTMAGCIAFCFACGYYLDKWLGTKVLFIGIFTVLGVAGGANVCYRQIMELMEESKKRKEQEQGPGSENNE